MIHLLACSCLSADAAAAFTLVMMGARRGKGGLQRNLEDTNNKSSSSNKTKRGAMNALNGGKGQEITGVTLPAPGTSVQYLIKLYTILVGSSLVRSLSL